MKDQRTWSCSGSSRPVRMSLLFQHSTSIPNAFTSLLERYHGVCGIFFNESDYSELFCFKGKSYFQKRFIIFEGAGVVILLCTLLHIKDLFFTTQDEVIKGI